MPQQEYFGVGSLKNLKNILKKEKVDKIFLVTGKESFKVSGAKAKIIPFLRETRWAVFSDFESNPKIENVKNGVALFKQYKPDLVVAVGGGSAIDTAKAINCLAAKSSENLIKAIKEKAFKKKGRPLVAIPTTSGTGSEATRYAVIYINKIKYSIDPEFNLPDYAIVDPSLTFNLPSRITACTGMDALAQAIESYWCVHSTKKSKLLAARAIKLILKNLRGAVTKPTKNNRIAMSKGSNLAGKAIEITRTTAPHAISYPLTAHFNIPHGQAVGLTLGQMLVYNGNAGSGDVLDPRGVRYVKKTIGELMVLLGATSGIGACAVLSELMESIGLATRLRELGIASKKNVELVTKEGFSPDRVKNNPRLLTKKALREMLYQIW